MRGRRPLCDPDSDIEGIGRRESNPNRNRDLHKMEETESMSVNLIFKIAAVGILVTVISQVLKHSGREEHAFLTSLAGLLIVLFWIVPYIYELFQTMKDLFAL